MYNEGVALGYPLEPLQGSRNSLEKGSEGFTA
jgi:hypothetical protein